MNATTTHGANRASAASKGTAPQLEKCRLCECKLNPEEKEDDFKKLLCGSCVDRPEAKNLLRLATVTPAPAPPEIKKMRLSRHFTESDKSLIRKVHGFMSMKQLLDVLNERLRADMGDSLLPYTIEQLQEEILAISEVSGAASGDWASLRKVLVQASRSGLLELITEQVIDDFAVVFSLNAKQLITLKDMLLNPAGDSE